jgi:signal peptidase I
MQILALLEDPIIVWGLVVVTIGIRVFWLKVLRPVLTPPAPEVVPRGKRQREPEPAAKAVKPKPKDMTLEVIDTVLIALILVFGLVRPYMLQTFFIPSSSMEPTLLGPYDPAKDEQFAGTQVKGGKRSGDKLIANKFVLRFRPPRRGEVIVFKPPVEAYVGNDPNLQMRYLLEQKPELISRHLPDLADAEKQRMLSSLPRLPVRLDDFIKRVIAVPGDHIRIKKDGDVYINGKPQTEPYVLTGLAHSTIDFPRKAPTMTIETAHGSSTSFFMGSIVMALYDRDLYARRIAPHVVEGDFIVPDNSVFVMGDNRSARGSFDSRYWGIVPFENIRGLAISTFWPPNRLKVL